MGSLQARVKVLLTAMAPLGMRTAGHPYTIGSGHVVHARVQKVGEPAVTEERAWGAHERVAVRRA